MRKERKYTIMTLMVLITTFLGACSSKSKTDIDRSLTVKVDSVISCLKQQSVSYPGKVKASSDINLSFRVSGTLLRTNLDVGSKVKRGQLIAEIDPRDYITQLEATQAEYNRIKGEAERIMALYEKRSVSKNDYEKAKFGLQQITAKLTAHQNAVADTKLIAPYDGFIQKKFFTKDETIGAGTPVYSMINNGKPEVEINIPSSEFYEKDSFESFYCSVDIFPNQSFPLELKGITHKANLNQLYTMRFAFTSGDYKTLPTAGMTATVQINKKTNDCDLVMVPMTALFNSDGDKPTVWIYNSQTNTISARIIELTGLQRDGNAIVSSGLTLHEQVVVAGVHSLKEGDKVTPLPPKSKSNVGGLL